jgi:hypothetical protein
LRKSIYRLFFLRNIKSDEIWKSNFRIEFRKFGIGQDQILKCEARFDVVRIKNRFDKDEVEEVSAEQIQAEFYGAETQGEDTKSNSTRNTASSNEGHNEKMYRDVLVNIRDPGSGLICEVQITLTGIAILKKSEQKIYSIMRMTSGQELLETFVFSRRADPMPMREMRAVEDTGTSEAVLEKGALQGKSGTDFALAGFRRSGTDIVPVPMSFNGDPAAAVTAPDVSADAAQPSLASRDVTSRNSEPFVRGERVNVVRIAELVQELQPSAQPNEIRTETPVGAGSCACACAPCASKHGEAVSNTMSL